ncbi:MAG: hypothetical protein JWM78_917 [Verrucomicrobiaceae bacterium]|nr:hypothetical protein [Verrucomicrobiaceae bacterium]
MKIFTCDCPKQNHLFFESVICNSCGRLVGYCPDLGTMQSFDPGKESGFWKSAQAETEYRQCENYVEHQVCNWMVPADDQNTLCRACRLNDVIPDLSQPQNIEYWRNIESAKRHALYSTLSLNLPLTSKHEDAELGLLFRFMTDREPVSEFTEPLDGQAPVFTGHNDGEITINLAEADDVARTRIRIKLGEAYRTLLGHFRHEIGHYYWFRLIENNPALLPKFREHFGDETLDYDEALERHYNNGAPADWADNFISPYASMHPWEDWAECWAHYMHMLDTLETSQAFELALGTSIPSVGLPTEQRDTNTIDILLKDWMRLAVGINALNRSMGMPDPYPFVLNNSVQKKLQWIHEVIVTQ